MPTIPLLITDEQYIALKWTAVQRSTPIETLIQDTVASFLAPLEARFKAAHKEEAAALFGGLSITKQLEVLTIIKTAAEPPVDPIS